MRPKSLKGKFTQLLHLSPGAWPRFISGWLHRNSPAGVPCVLPGCSKLLYLPPQDFYDSYEFFAEHPEGRRELGYFMERIKATETFYDIGAFRGVFATACKQKLGAAAVVHAFEPIKRNIQAVEQIGRLNQFSNFVVVPMAVGDGGTLPGNETDDMLRADTAAPGATEAINTVSLDEYLRRGNPPPTLMKIDVEGYELQVINGARECLKTHRPRLWLEVHPNFLKGQQKTPEDVMGRLRDIGYKISVFEDHELPTRDISFHVWCE